ncbi:MAG: hypothetical protein C0392_00495 [Syntrophus sp. (in: bacteria)]|nr:hypothetical protein [Syntrophus sp. (in: bacteria)]
MGYLVFILLFLIIFPMNGLCQIKVNIIKPQVEQGALSDTEADKYRSFLREMRTSDAKRVFVDYNEDRDTKYRKLRESIAFEEREGRIAGARAWEGRYKDTHDARMSYIEKGYSTSTNSESNRAFKAASQLRPPARSRTDSYNR